MGGLRQKMPWTAYTMLAGCLAIIGAGVPFSIGLSGHYSKDAILAQALLFKSSNPQFGWLFFVAAGGAAITAFYMFRLWFMTFAGKPRDHHIYDHAHESPRIMYLPLVVLAVFAVFVGGTLRGLSVQNLLEQAGRPARWSHRPAGCCPSLKYPSEHDLHLEANAGARDRRAGGLHHGDGRFPAGHGVVWLADVGIRRKWPTVPRRCTASCCNKWYFDELYQAMFVQPVLFVSRRVAQFDKA